MNHLLTLWRRLRMWHERRYYNTVAAEYGKPQEALAFHNRSLAQMEKMLDDWQPFGKDKCPKCFFPGGSKIQHQCGNDDILNADIIE